MAPQPHHPACPRTRLAAPNLRSGPPAAPSPRAAHDETAGGLESSLQMPPDPVDRSDMFGFRRRPAAQVKHRATPGQESTMGAEVRARRRRVGRALRDGEPIDADDMGMA